MQILTAMKTALRRTLRIFLILFSVLAVLATAALTYYFSVTAGVRLDSAKLTLDTSYINVYDKDGAEIVSAKKQAATPFEELPAHLPQAFVAVEDKRFYDHNGFDYKRIGKAILKNIASFSFKEGASTISQQLIKNTHLSSEKTLTRKLKEFKLTRALEKRYDKNKIMELYLNSIYFGHSAFGASKASAFYFGKDVREITPAESAMLSALVQSPNRYSPFRSPERCLARRNLVLRLMREQGFLSQTQYETATAEPLPERAHESDENAYLSAVYERADEILGPRGRRGIHVYTFYDKELQGALCAQTAESDLCLAVRDNRTHGIKAFHSTCGAIERLPASTIKPLLVYAPALEENIISPLTPLSDSRTDFNGYSPDDCGGATGKYMSARYALSHSVNIPAVRVLNSLGVERGVQYLHKMNPDIPRDDYSLALALGGMKKGFTLLQMSDAYAVFANGGTFSPSSFIRTITDEKGRELYSFRPESRRVFSEDVCYIMNDMLQTTVREGTAKKLRTLDFEVCAKTGTGEGKNGNVDAYTMSYTHDDTVCVWLGNRDNSPVRATGGGLPANIALAIYERLYRNRKPSSFPACDGVEYVNYDLQEYENERRIVLADPLAPPAESGRELFRKCALPQTACTRYSSPSIRKPTISVKNGAVLIELCQKQYYEYVIKRQNRNETVTIYSGKYTKTICDNSVKSGESYTYTVTPYYKGRAGESVILPSVRIEKTQDLPDEWWNDQ